MEPAVRSRFCNLPLEIVLIIFKYAAKPTFSQKEEYTDQNPYATAISLCLVSRLARRTILPEFLHTVLLRQRHSVKQFANALLMQKAYAKDKSDLFFNYIPAVQRMWISRSTEHSLWIYELTLNMRVLVPVLLAVPTLAIDCCYLNIITESVEDEWTSRTDPNVDHGLSPFPGKTQSLTIVGEWTNTRVFEQTRKRSIFLAPISHITYLIDLEPYSDIFRDISRGLKSPQFPLVYWLNDIPWACMKSLETVSVVYPYLAPPHKIRSYIDQTRGLDLHVERLTVSAPLYREDPRSFPWVTPPFPVTRPGEESTRSDGLSVKVTHDQGHFCRFYFTWDKVWASGLTD